VIEAGNMVEPHKSEPGKPPAFQFYANDFTAGTRAMTLTEVGAYIRLLCYQWDSGSVPDGDAKRLSIILACNPSQALKLWTVLAHKFVCEAGECRNPRLERERQAQTNYRRLQSERGKASAAARKQATLVDSRLQPKSNQRSNAGSTESPTESPTLVQPRPVAIRLQPEGNSSSSSSVRTSVNVPTTAAISTPSDAPRRAVTPPTLIRSPLQHEKKSQTCIYVGARLEVPRGLHANLVIETGGDDSHRALMAFYADLDERLEQTREPIFPNGIDFVRSQWQRWMVETGRAKAAMKADSRPSIEDSFTEAKRILAERAK